MPAAGTSVGLQAEDASLVGKEQQEVDGGIDDAQSRLPRAWSCCGGPLLLRPLALMLRQFDFS